MEELTKSSTAPNLVCPPPAHPTAPTPAPPKDTKSHYPSWDAHVADESGPIPFVGRLGGNQLFALNPNDPRNEDLLKNVPDAAPFMSLRQQLDLRPLRNPTLWKQAVTEGMGSLLLVYITVYASISPDIPPNPPDSQFGNFDNAAFIGPLIGALSNFLFLTLFTIVFGGISGAHLNPTVTLATFCARLCSLPRLVLYVAFQIGGSALAGLLVRASYGTRDFKTGGCWIFPELVPVTDALVIELFATLTLLFLAFGVGLDPRQKAIIAPSLAPFLVGLSLGSITLATGFSRYGYGGASANPARCFGAFVGSGFPSWHWYHWVADIVACLAHGVYYFLVPPWQKEYSNQRF